MSTQAELREAEKLRNRYRLQRAFPLTAAKLTTRAIPYAKPKKRQPSTLRSTTLLVTLRPFPV